MDSVTLRDAAMKHCSLIPEPFDDILTKESGFESLKAFCDYFGGCTVYIPNIQTVLKKCLEKEAIEEFNGVNHIALARKYGFTERQLRKILYKPRQ